MYSCSYSKVLARIIKNIVCGISVAILNIEKAVLNMSAMY
jgi:hypothetical protein